MHGIIFKKLINLTVLKKSPINFYFRINRRLWSWLPQPFANCSLVRVYGGFLHTIALLHSNRSSNFGTLFMRNRAQLEFIRRFCNQLGKNSILRIAVLGCSKGAEVYSIMWTIRKARPDIKITMYAVDISPEILDFAQKGVYSLKRQEYTDTQIFCRISEEEMCEMFDVSGDHAQVKSWLREGIIWRIADVRDPKIMNLLGSQDIVTANNFLCHIDAPSAENCLNNIGHLIKSGGYIIVSGIDLDVRTKVASKFGWEPVKDLMEEIHDGDSFLRRGWPLEYWGLEPLNKARPDWKVRYASVFQIGERE